MTHSLKTIENHLKDLSKEVADLEQFKEIYQKVIPDVKALIDELFDRDDIRALPEYSTLKWEYRDRIHKIFDPINFTQLIVETTLPGIYDAPGDRKKKIAGVNKLVKELGSGVSPNSDASANTPVKTNVKKIAKIVAKKPMIYDDEAIPEVKDDCVQKVPSTEEPKCQIIDVLTHPTQDSPTQPDNNQLPTPDLMYVQIGAHKYIYNPEDAKVYKHTENDGLGLLVGEIKDGKIFVENKSYSLRVEKVIELKDLETEQTFYKDCNDTYYEKINDVDGWIVGLDTEQTARLQA